MHRFSTLVGASLCLTLLAGCGAKPVAPDSPIARMKVQVREFDLRGAHITDWVGPTDTYGALVAQKIAENLRERGVAAQATPQDAPLAGDLVVEGKVNTIDGGSRALRYWVGFGAGAARFSVEGTAKGSDGKLIGEFADERRSGFGIFGGDYETLLQNCAAAVGEDIAEMVVTGQYGRTF